MNKICAFAGYRPKKITMNYDSDSNAYSTLINEAAKIISDLAFRGTEIFYTDMSMGMGMWCAEIVLSLQKQFGDLKLIADVPFHGQCDNWPESYQEQYMHILSYCHKVYYLNEKYNEMFAVLAQTELEKKVKRQKEGIAEKKRRGEWDDYGRPRVMTLEKFRMAYANVESGNATASECKKDLGMTNSAYYRYVKMMKELSAALTN